MTDLLFFELIRAALGNQKVLSRIPSQREWSALYGMAEKQALLGVCFSGLQNLGGDSCDGFAKIGMGEMLYLTWMGMMAAIQQKNEQVNHQCVELQSKLAADGIRSCILKGQGIGSLYKVKSCDSVDMASSNCEGKDMSLFRQSGDIDVWIDADRDEVILYVKRNCPNEDVDVSSKHIEFRLFNDTVVEAHFVPAGMGTPIIGRRMRAYYESEKSDQMKHRVVLSTGDEIVAPTPDFQAVHILHHIFGHFLFEGIGMRQLVDYYFVLQQSFTDAEISRIISTLKKFEMYRFAQGVSYIVMNVFGAKDCFIAADEGLGKRILADVMQVGNFGNYDNNRDAKKVESSWYRFWYHNIRMWKYFDVAPWTILTSPFMRIREYFWRLVHGYFKKNVK